MAICPICKVDSVKKRPTWRGLLWAILCFPCGIYCCLKNRVWYCPLCTYEIYYSDGSEPTFNRQYRFYKTFKKIGSSSGNNNSEQGTSRTESAVNNATTTATTTISERTHSDGSQSVNSTTPVLRQ